MVAHAPRASAIPTRVRSLFVACTGAVGRPRGRWSSRAADAEALGMEGVLDVTLERWFTAGGARAATPSTRGVDYARSALLALDPAAFADGWRAIGGHDARRAACARSR